MTETTVTMKTITTMTKTILTMTKTATMNGMKCTWHIRRIIPAATRTTTTVMGVRIRMGMVRTIMVTRGRLGTVWAIMATRRVGMKMATRRMGTVWTIMVTGRIGMVERRLMAAVVGRTREGMIP